MKPRRLHSATTLSMVTTSVGTRPGSLGAVVPRQRVAVGRVLAEPGLEIGGALDLVLRAFDAQRGVVDVDRRHEPSGHEHGLAEDGRAGVDEQVGAVDVLDDVLDAAHAAVDRLDAHAVEIGAVVTHVAPEGPQVLSHEGRSYTPAPHADLRVPL